MKLQHILKFHMEKPERKRKEDLYEYKKNRVLEVWKNRTQRRIKTLSMRVSHRFPSVHMDYQILFQTIIRHNDNQAQIFNIFIPQILMHFLLKEIKMLFYFLKISQSISNLCNIISRKTRTQLYTIPNFSFSTVQQPT